MRNIKTFLSGKKSYIVGLLMIALGVATDNSGQILEGFAIITLRAGIAK